MATTPRYEVIEDLSISEVVSAEDSVVALCTAKDIC
jgi:hypothetical protein